ncbi:MAG: LPS-assembly protein LptD, partial [Planctomycetes bacterium]|nr:LPS-assembly protein LptD [Planctomycetota bacterium]
MTGLVLWMAVLVGGFAANDGSDSAQLLAGEDLHIQAPRMWACRQTQTPDEHILLFENGFSMSIGDNQLSSRNAVVWLRAWGGGQPGFSSQTYYQAQVYLETDVSFRQGKRAKTTSLEQVIMEDGYSLLVRFLVSGEVFATADEQKELACEELQKQDLYQRGSAEAVKIHDGPEIAKSAQVPELPVVPQGQTPATVVAAAGQEAMPAVVSAAEAAASTVVTEPMQQPKQKEPVFTYPVHVSAVWDPEPTVEKMTKTPDECDVITVSGRFYLWQRQSADSLLEFQADSAVLFFQSGQFETTRQQGGRDLAQGNIESAYLRGNIVMTEGRRTIRADEIYYDFLKKQAVVVNASMRMFDEKRGLPIYLSAQRLRQVSDSLFQAEEVALTSSEFYLPQVSANASRIVVMKDETVQQRAEAMERARLANTAQAAGEKDDEAAKYVGTMYNMNMKYYNTTVFGWPKIRSRFVRPDIPLSRIAVGNDSEYGTSVETRWHLFRLLGLKEPAGMNAELAADYFSKRGVGGGVEGEYEFDHSFGNFIGYILKDRGTDDLGRTNDRRNLDSGQDLRGRLGFRHREYLPDDWQATVEVGYLSDRNFYEWMYREEFYTDKGQETLIHLKQQRDNWALAILGKVRINDFETMTEEMPTIEYHRTGQSFWDHQLTWYSDSRISRLRDRYDDDAPGHPNQRYYTFGSTRNEADWPFMIGTAKVVPFVAGTYAYEDQTGYDLALNGDDKGDDNYSGTIVEGGVRASTMFWKEDPTVRSRLWDLDGIRHIVMPHLEAVTYEESETGLAQRDMVNLGLSQRWQTHRGEGEDRRIVDWLRLDVDSTWLSDDESSPIGPAGTYGPAGFIFNNPSIPVFLRRNDRYFGIVRNSINADAEWRLTDTMTVLGDMNYDTRSGVVQQLDMGLSRYVFPDLSLYLGSRYLRPIIINAVDDGKLIHEEGSHSVVAAVTYQLGQRYWLTCSQEYNFDFGRAVRSSFGVVRQYHRLFYSLEASFD